MSHALLSATVSEIIQETPDVKVIVLVPSAGLRLPAYAPGAHIDVATPCGLIRQYSLCALYEDGTSYRIAIKLVEESRGGSRDMHNHLAVGDSLLISSPRNNFGIQKGAHHVLIAGGIGITPLFAMMQHLEATSQSYELHYFARHESQVCFRAEIMRPEVASKVRLHLGVSPNAMPQVLEGIIGMPGLGHQIYFCGPAAMMGLIEQCAGKRQWPQDALHREYFTPAKQTDEASKGSFNVKLNSTQQTFHIAADKSILQVLRENGLNPVSSCEQGTCGTCICKVLDGAPDHRDHFLSEFQKKSGKKIAICVSRSNSELLTLDL